jgi:TonB family protein
MTWMLKLDPRMASSLKRLCMGFCLLIVSKSSQAADVSGTWVGTLRINGSDESVCLSLASGPREVTGRIAYRDDRELGAVKGRETAGGIELESSDDSQRQLQLKVHVDGSTLSGEAVIGDQTGTISANKYSWPSSVYRLGKGPGSPQPIRTGPRPAYTDQARTAKIEGSVMLDVQVLSNGQVGKEVQVVRGLGFGLDERAIDFVRTWVFAPPYEVCRSGPRIKVNVNFRLGR